ncbi:Hypothetical predicted protein [Pelobates cultripes]|uniref:Uncharacterized protein n=1 Tax=Pelobates cultripes TaxID=61616 RepID=A0AAD1T6A3_PELCU|nr:Hypothetical predicted protein [Pelobates cultripes]
MADGTAAHTAQAPTDWAIAFQTRFDAICRQFWDRLEHQHQSSTPPRASGGTQTPAAWEPARASYPDRRKTKAQPEGPQPGKPTAKPTKNKNDSPLGMRVIRSKTLTSHTHLRKRAKYPRKRQSAALRSPTPGKDLAPKRRRVRKMVVPALTESQGRKGAPPGIHRKAQVNTEGPEARTGGLTDIHPTPALTASRRGIG